MDPLRSLHASQRDFAVTAFKPPAPESIIFAGPAGALEGLLEVPGTAPAGAVAVICHPHPLHGGTMQNKVVHMLARTFHESGVPTLRFNYRGVGRSEGAYDEGRGETEDACAALDYMSGRWPGRGLWLAGFSFGGAVAFRAAGLRSLQRLVLAAPAVQRVDLSTAAMPSCPWLVVQGDADEVIDPKAVSAWVAGLRSEPEFVMLPGVGHFFHGRLDDLRGTVRAWIQKHETRM